MVKADIADKWRVVVQNWDLSAVISNFKDGRLPADSLGLLFTFPFIHRIWATLQTYREDIMLCCLYVHKIKKGNIDLWFC